MCSFYNKDGEVQMELKYCADHIDLILAKNRADSKVLFETEHSIVILDESMPCLFISCTDEDEIKDMMQCIDDSKGYTMAVHQEKIAEFFPEYQKYLRCVNLLYEKDSLEELISPYPIRRLESKDVQQASMLYRKMEENGYVRHCIERNACYGMFDGEKLIAMIGEHDEEFMGLLEVHPDYRRRHLAMILLNDMMHVQTAKGKPAASQIEIGNEASFRLHEKLGFTKGNEIVTWMRVRKRKL